MRKDRFERWPEYVSVAERKKNSLDHANKLKKKGIKLNPVVIEGRTIARTFWGKSWCDNLESYSDFSNRLPRGRTYVRNGSVIDLQITKGKVKAQVMGSSLYNVTIDMNPMPESNWKTLVRSCTGKIDSLIELLQGKFSKAVMEIITRKEGGLFPKPKEISMKCSCPDSADMCKHIAAVLYGVGAILDVKPEWLFDLRHVNHVDLITIASTGDMLTQNQDGDHLLEDSDLAAMFGIEMDSSLPTKTPEVVMVKKKIEKKAVSKATPHTKLEPIAMPVKITEVNDMKPKQTLKAAKKKSVPIKPSKTKLRRLIQN